MMSYAQTSPSFQLVTLPFVAVVGHAPVKRALLLLAIEPRLRGVAFAAPAGSAKSVLARGFAQIVPDVDGRRPPFVILPGNISEDRLFGGLDLEATLAGGRRRFAPGVLAQAHGGYVFADNLNLLPTQVENALLTCLDEGCLRVEREGVSLTSPADFGLIAAFNPGDGSVRWHILDRLGLIVAAPRQPDLETRQKVIETVAAFERDPEALQTLYAEETSLLQNLLTDARRRLPQVTLSDETMHWLCARAAALGTVGQRAEYFATLAARANAALEGRTTVNEDDCRTAEFFVLLPRATQRPDSESEPPPPPPPPPSDSSEDEPEPPSPPEELEDLALVFDAEEAALDADFDFFAKKARLGRYGKRSERDNFQSGRHVRSVPGEPSRGRVAIEATLRQAAPHQPARRQKLLANGQTPDRILLKKDDVRLKKLRQRTGALIVFIVDASGSMAANRMGQAKGAVVELLRQSYVNRDKVALIGCYGDESRVLLAPTQSVEAAKRQLETLPTGGATPLNDALRRAHALIEEVRRTGAYTEALVIVIGDGRGNVPARAAEPDGNLPRADAIRRELEDMARVYAAGTIRLVVFDTQNRFVSRGEARQLAELFSGRYIYLPRLSAAGITDAVRQELRRSS